MQWILCFLWMLPKICTYKNTFWNSKLGKLLVSNISNLQYRLSVRKEMAVIDEQLEGWGNCSSLPELELTDLIASTGTRGQDSCHVFIILTRLTLYLVLLLTWGSFHNFTNALSGDRRRSTHDIYIYYVLIWSFLFNTTPSPLALWMKWERYVISSVAPKIMSCKQQLLRLH